MAESEPIRAARGDQAGGEMQTLAAYVEYDGRGFVGWQAQHGLRSVQGEVERALGVIANETVRLRCAGRTDAGVHATGQVVHWQTTAQRTARSWMLGTNANLPPDVSLYWVGRVADDFDARFRAVSRRYRYLILNTPARSALHAGRCLYEPRPLALAPMQQAAARLVGERDLSAFRGRDCQARSPVKRVHSLELARAGAWITLDIHAGGFLHNMVRNIVGTLIEVGRGARPPEWIDAVLASGRRERAGPTVAPGGLYFLGAEYEDHFGLPPFRRLPLPLE